MSRRDLKMKNVFMLVTLMAVAWACRGEKQPKDVIDMDKLETIYVELLDSASGVQKDSSNITISPTAERILARHQVSIDQLRATVNYYNEDTKRWKLFYENVVTKVNQSSLKNTSR